MAGRPRDARLDDAIRTAADELLCTVGYSRLTMERVAERANVPRSTLYSRWRSKTDLVAAIVAASIMPVASTGPDTELVAAFDADCRHALGPYGLACALIFLEAADTHAEIPDVLASALQGHRDQLRTVLAGVGLGTTAQLAELDRILTEIRVAPLARQLGVTIEAAQLVARLVGT